MTAPIQVIRAPVAGGAGGAHAATHQADGNDTAQYIEMAPDANVTVPTGYGFVVVGPYQMDFTLTLQGTARMVVL